MAIKRGDHIEVNKTITAESALEFARFSEDYNPIHFEDEAARCQGYDRSIAHGLMIGSFFSSIIGTELPGDGSIYVSQNLEFKRPIYIGDSVKLIVKVTDIDEEESIYTLQTRCINSNNKIAVDGEAKVLYREDNDDQIKNY